MIICFNNKIPMDNKCVEEDFYSLTKSGLAPNQLLDIFRNILKPNDWPGWVFDSSPHSSTLSNWALTALKHDAIISIERSVFFMIAKLQRLINRNIMKKNQKRQTFCLISHMGTSNTAYLILVVCFDFCHSHIDRQIKKEELHSPSLPFLT